MTGPAAITVGHERGAAEAGRRVETGLRRFSRQIGAASSELEKDWKDNHLSSPTPTTGESACGRVEVAGDAVDIGLDLPGWMNPMARGSPGRGRPGGRRLFEKKSWKTFAQAANPAAAGAPRGLRERISALSRTRFHPRAGPFASGMWEPRGPNARLVSKRKSGRAMRRGLM